MKLWFFMALSSAISMGYFAVTDDVSMTILFAVALLILWDGRHYWEVSKWR